MDYAEAKKKVQAEKPKENFMIVEINGLELVFPHKAGLDLLAAFANAERFDGWSSSRRIVAIESRSIESKLLSRKEYEQYKMAALLNISFQEVKDMEERAKQSQ